MKPYVKYGLIVGVIALVVTIPVAALLGVCAPGVAVIAGFAAGFLAVRNDAELKQGDGPKFGAYAGAVSGALTTIGQLIGGIGILIIAQTLGVQTMMGSVPSASATTAELIGYYGGGLAAGCCLGLVGLALGAGTGAIGGMLAARPATPPSVTPPPSVPMP